MCLLFICNVLQKMTDIKGKEKKLKRKRLLKKKKKKKKKNDFSAGVFSFNEKLTFKQSLTNLTNFSFNLYYFMFVL